MGAWLTIRCPTSGCTYEDDFRLEVGEETDPVVLAEFQWFLRVEHPNHIAHDRLEDPLDDAYPICPAYICDRELVTEGHFLWWICECGITPAR